MRNHPISTPPPQHLEHGPWMPGEGRGCSQLLLAPARGSAAAAPREG